MHSLCVCAHWTTCMWHYLTGSWQVALASWHWHTSSIPVYCCLTLYYTTGGKWHPLDYTDTHIACQEYIYLLNDTIWQNIVYGDTWLTLVDIWHASIQLASDTHFVKYLPQCLAVIWHDTSCQFYSCHIKQSLMTGVLCIEFMLTLYNIVYSG